MIVRRTAKRKFIASLLRFHVYYTTLRRVLYELGAALPDEVDFDSKKNSYSRTPHTRLISEFHPSDEDFRFKGAQTRVWGQFVSTMIMGDIL